VKNSTPLIVSKIAGEGCFGEGADALMNAVAEVVTRYVTSHPPPENLFALGQRLRQWGRELQSARQLPVCTLSQAVAWAKKHGLGTGTDDHRRDFVALADVGLIGLKTRFDQGSLATATGSAIVVLDPAWMSKCIRPFVVRDGTKQLLPHAGYSPALLAFLKYVGILVPHAAGASFLLSRTVEDVIRGDGSLDLLGPPQTGQKEAGFAWSFEPPAIVPCDFWRRLRYLAVFGHGVARSRQSD
jgi:hypothetical protein